jgi:hypothetical protein
MKLLFSNALVTLMMVLSIVAFTPAQAVAQRQGEVCNDKGCGCGNPAPIVSTGYGRCGCLGKDFDYGCGCGSKVQNLGCGCGKPAPSSYVCQKCFDNSSCIGCDGVVFSGKTDVGCGCGVAKKSDGCCPNTYFYPDSGACKTSGQICQDIFYSMVQLNTITFHPDSVPKVVQSSSLYHIQPSGVGVAFQSAADVNQHSSCLYSAMQSCSPVNVNAALISRWSNGDIDNCVANVLRTWGPVQTYQGKAQVFGVISDVWSNSAYVRRNASGGCGPAPQWMVALRDALSCGVLYYHFHDFASPVSLLWTDDVEIDRVVSYSKFPLSPSTAGKTMLWRGSSLTPLLVYDPAGKGIIESSQQLFGNHTFGKKWKDGYEALASLDTEKKDGWLEGKELDSIALWFDHNRDGVSQSSEIKSLKEVGITAIGVRSDRRDAKTKSVFASKGFKRTVDGKEYVGRSVDWFGAPVEGEPKREVSDFEVPIMKGLSDYVVADAKTFDITSSMHGVWKWEVTDDKKLLPEQRPGGMFAITQEGNKLRGMSLSSAVYLPNAYSIDERVDSKRLIGVVSSAQPGEAKFEFVVGVSAGVEAKSTAKLSADGMKLIGETTERLELDGKLQDVTYHWEASRLVR